MRILRHATKKQTETDAEVYLVESDYNLSRTEQCLLEVLVCVSRDKKSNIYASMYTMYDSRLIDPDDETETMDELFNLLVELGGTQGRRTPYTVPNCYMIPEDTIFELVESQIEKIVSNEIFNEGY